LSQFYIVDAAKKMQQKIKPTSKENYPTRNKEKVRIRKTAKW
jgi:hypothetical protein